MSSGDRKSMSQSKPAVWRTSDRGHAEISYVLNRTHKLRDHDRNGLGNRNKKWSRWGIDFSHCLVQLFTKITNAVDNFAVIPKMNNTIFKHIIERGSYKMLFNISRHEASATKDASLKKCPTASYKSVNVLHLFHGKDLLDRLAKVRHFWKHPGSNLANSIQHQISSWRCLLAWSNCLEWDASEHIIGQHCGILSCIQTVQFTHRRLTPQLGARRLPVTPLWKAHYLVVSLVTAENKETKQKNSIKVAVCYVWFSSTFVKHVKLNFKTLQKMIYLPIIPDFGNLYMCLCTHISANVCTLITQIAREDGEIFRLKHFNEYVAPESTVHISAKHVWDALNCLCCLLKK